MTNRLACDHADLLASVVNLAGAQWNDVSKCKPTEPVNYLHIHGTKDDTIKYDGGDILGVLYPSAVQSATSWMNFNGCTADSLVAGTPIDIVSN